MLLTLGLPHDPSSAAKQQVKAIRDILFPTYGMRGCIRLDYRCFNGQGRSPHNGRHRLRIV
jgi:hypothetical protein